VQARRHLLQASAGMLAREPARGRAWMATGLAPALAPSGRCSVPAWWLYWLIELS
jgi:hypothetical protein